MSHPAPFECEVVYDGDGLARLQPSGDLDMASVDVLDARIQEAHAEGKTKLIVDLSRLHFMDSTGLSLLARWSLGAARDGYDFALVPGNNRVQRLFELTGLVSHFQFVDG
jgi:anti-sigma B factor antagonist